MTQSPYNTPDNTSDNTPYTSSYESTTPLGDPTDHQPLVEYGTVNATTSGDSTYGRYSDTTGTGYSDTSYTGTSYTGSGYGSESATQGTSTTDAAKEQASQVADTAKDQASQVADTAKQQAAQVKDTAVGAAQDVAGTAKDEAQRVAGEAADHVRNLVDQGRTQLQQQAQQGHDMLAGTVRSLTDELSQMVQGSSTSGPVNQFASAVASRGQGIASWLESHEPADALDEVRRFAARRPWAFLAAAAGAGLVAGRLARGTRDAVADQKDRPELTTGRAGYVPQGYADTTYSTTPVSGTTYGSGYTTTTSPRSDWERDPRADRSTDAYRSSLDVTFDDTFGGTDTEGRR